MQLPSFVRAVLIELSWPEWSSWTSAWHAAALECETVCAQATVSPGAEPDPQGPTGSGDAAQAALEALTDA